jgi:hypothetical protein
MNDWCVEAAGPAYIQTVRLESTNNGNDDMNKMISTPTVRLESMINGNDDMNMMISIRTLTSTVSFPGRDELEA